MFYEETIINGVLHCRNTPATAWRPAAGAHADLVNGLGRLTDADRVRVFDFFCTYCGDIKPPYGCSCIKDE